MARIVMREDIGKPAHFFNDNEPNVYHPCVLIDITQRHGRGCVCEHGEWWSSARVIYGEAR